MARKNKKQRLTVVHPHCAGIDIGSREHWVAVDPECCDEPVRRFTTFSDDLYELADWLQSLQVDSDVVCKAPYESRNSDPPRDA